MFNSTRVYIQLKYVAPSMYCMQPHNIMTASNNVLRCMYASNADRCLWRQTQVHSPSNVTHTIYVYINHYIVNLTHHAQQSNDWTRRCLSKESKRVY